MYGSGVCDSDPPEGGGLLAACRELAERAAALATADLEAVDDREVLAAAEQLERAHRSLAAAATALTDRIDRRTAYVHHGCVTTVSWLRWRLRLDPAQARKRVAAARLLRRLPRFTAAAAAGAVDPAHLAVLTRAAATPQRRVAVVAAGPTLLRLAITGEPRDLRVAVAHPRSTTPRPWTRTAGTCGGGCTSPPRWTGWWSSTDCSTRPPARPS